MIRQSGSGLLEKIMRCQHPRAMMPWISGQYPSRHMEASCGALRFCLPRRRSASRHTIRWPTIKNPAGADRERYGLHDAVQLAGGQLPDDLSRSCHAADDWHDHHDWHDERRGKHVVPDDLQLDAASHVRRPAPANPPLRNSVFSRTFSREPLSQERRWFRRSAPTRFPWRPCRPRLPAPRDGNRASRCARYAA